MMDLPKSVTMAMSAGKQEREQTSMPRTRAPKRPRDFNQRAKLIVDIATGQVEEEQPKPVNESSRNGGLKGGKARAEALTPERRSEIARKGAMARWSK